MKKMIWVIAIIILASTIIAFGQNQRKKKAYYNLPEVGDEVLVAFRKKKTNSRMTSRRKSSHDKYANQEVSYRKKSKFRKVKGVKHDPEFENWANRKGKTTKTRRINK